jgi:hypothetical protein
MSCPREAGHQALGFSACSYCLKHQAGLFGPGSPNGLGLTEAEQYFVGMLPKGDPNSNGRRWVPADAFLPGFADIETDGNRERRLHGITWRVELPFAGEIAGMT